MNTPPTIQIEDPFAKPPVPNSSFVLFNYGFRPFFLFAGLFGALSVPLWVGLFAGHMDMNLIASPALWHGHEMIFGYATAAIAGFFLTVVPNWTSAKVSKGPVLIGLSILWIVGRVAFWSQGVLPYGLVIAADMLFLLGLLALVIRPLINPQYRRQFVFVPILGFIILANAMTHLGVIDFDALGIDWGARGLTLGLDSMLVLITIMGGRVTPSFTSSYLGHNTPGVKVQQRPGLDRAVFWITWAVLAVNLVLPLSVYAGVISLIAAVLHGVRLAGWQGWRVLDNPILWILHLAYLWLVVGLVLMGLADFGVIAMSDAVHALTIGMIGTYTLGLMSRASLGHTGRAVHAAPLTVVAYVLITLAALSRLAIIFAPDLSVELVMVSGVAWTLAMVAYCVVYVPILVRPRIDGRPG
ncbi:MAG: NnrS family protein [Magnetovibrio sp.]|nr:NnrS family protein [Magnetovibrio sp.]